MICHPGRTGCHLHTDASFSAEEGCTHTKTTAHTAPSVRTNLPFFLPFTSSSSAQRRPPCFRADVCSLTYFCRFTCTRVCKHLGAASVCVCARHLLLASVVAGRVVRSLVCWCQTTAACLRHQQRSDAHVRRRDRARPVSASRSRRGSV